MLSWSDKFATNIELIDTQHKQVFELLNKLGDSFKKSSYTEEQIDEAFRQLNDYSRQHFEEETRLMAENNVDPRHIRMHCMEHKSFIYDAERLWEHPITEESMSDISEKLVSFITAWWSYHIIGMDQTLAAQIAAIKSGMSPEEAYETWKIAKHEPIVTRLMLDSVLDLWRGLPHNAVILWKNS